MTREVRLGDGEAVDSIPLAWVGERCLDAAKAFNAAHADTTKRAYIHELLELVVQLLGGHAAGAGLKSCMHAPFSGTENAAETLRVLKLVVDGRLPGIEPKAPGRPQSLADMYKAERTNMLCAQEPEKARGEHRRAATETWNSTYKENLPNQLRDLRDLRARHTGLHQEYEECYCEWMEGMEEAPPATSHGSTTAAATSHGSTTAAATASAAAAATTAAVEALQQATEAGAVDGASALAAAATQGDAAAPSTTAAVGVARPFRNITRAQIQSIVFVHCKRLSCYYGAR